MSMRPLAIISAHSPQLEAIAHAILAGASEESGAVPLPPVVAHSVDDLAPALSAPYVFLGWRGDIEESRRFAERALAELATATWSPRHVATFEVSLRGAGSDSAAGSPEREVVDRTSMKLIPPPSRFAIDCEPGGEFTGFLELARARAWGGHVYRQWFPSPSVPAAEHPRRDPSGGTPGSAAWCGATE
jgi:hypothetical protein